MIDISERSSAVSLLPNSAVCINFVGHGVRLRKTNWLVPMWKASTLSLESFPGAAAGAINARLDATMPWQECSLDRHRGDATSFSLLSVS